MNEFVFKDYYFFVKETIPILLKEKTQDTYTINTQLMQGIPYNKNLNAPLGISITKLFLEKPKIETFLYDLDINTYVTEYRNPLNILIIREHLTYLKKSINILPNRLKLIINLFLFENNSLVEIAKRFNDTCSNIHNDYLLGLALIKYYFIHFCHTEKFSIDEILF